MNFSIFGMTPWFPIMAVFAILAVISFFHINSLSADNMGQPKGNRRYIIIGVVLSIIAIICLVMAINTSTGQAG